MDYNKSIEAQYNAALAMLQTSIERCPDDLWNIKGRGNTFWRIAYHALLYTDLYLEERPEDYKSWDGHRPAYTFEGADDPALADAVCSKPELLAYVNFCRRKVAERVPQLDLAAPSGFHWLPFTKFELQLYTIRHIQQHTGELTERLGPEAGVDWVGSQPG
ncbi:MAG: DinB family protein [Anaerolineales bacterium]|nr:DinB family protein [Anaerolineales bacterium]